MQRVGVLAAFAAVCLGSMLLAGCGTGSPLGAASVSTPPPVVETVTVTPGVSGPATDAPPPTPQPPVATAPAVDAAMAQSLGVCATACTITGTVSFDHPTFGPVTLVTSLGEPAPAEANAALIDASGTVVWRLPGSAQERRMYEFALASPARDSTGLYFITYNPGRYDGLTILQPSESGMTLIAGWYGSPTDPSLVDLYFAELSGLDADGRYVVLKHRNDCRPSCAQGATTTTVLHWDGTTFVS